MNSIIYTRAKPMAVAYMEYDENKHTVSSNMRLAAISNRPCNHYNVNETGEPRFDLRRQPSRLDPVATRPTAARSTVQKLLSVMRKLLGGG